ncbi:MAG: type II toxin-antitoxin system HigB family toxin [Bacteroidales bacterium]|jgi:mRNA interferase HigB|nr:type II toxin-antitoxin system HigB family toxin [Bacteroidales bacterium]
MLLDKFTIKHAGTLQAIDRWIETVESAQWKNHNDLKRTFPSADYIGKSRYVFNIKGNNYRIISVVQFIGNMLVVCFVGTHSEYDKTDCLTVMQ